MITHVACLLLTARATLSRDLKFVYIADINIETLVFINLDLSTTAAENLRATRHLYPTKAFCFLRKSEKATFFKK